MQETINQLEDLNYQLEGQMGGSVGALVGLVIAVGTAVFVMIFTGVMSGEVYETSLSPLLVNTSNNSAGPTGFGITNDSVRNAVGGAVLSGFSAFEQTGDYMPILVLAFIIALVLSLVLGFASLGGGKSGGKGTAL